MRKMVYLIQSKESLLIHGCFSSMEKAKKYIEGSKTMYILEAEVI